MKQHFTRERIRELMRQARERIVRAYAELKDKERAIRERAQQAAEARRRGGAIEPSV
jgi:hypothetical protein